MHDFERSEPVRIASKMWIVASENDTFRVLSTERRIDIEHELSVSYRSPRTVRALLNGALYAAFATRGKYGKPQPISAVRLVYMLAGSYHHLQTPPRLARAASTFKCLNRDNIATFLDLKVSEETGHEHLALQDLAALGLPAERIVEVLRPPASLRLLKLLDSYSRGSYPIEVLGYTFLHGTSRDILRRERHTCVPRGLPIGCRRNTMLAGSQRSGCLTMNTWRRSSIL
jgi:hypothetical protein